MNKDIIKAHKFSFKNKDKLLQDKLCGCFCCLKIFSPDKFSDNDWVVEPDGEETALCPYCGVDSVISESSGYPITKEFLSEMRQYWCSEDKEE